MSAKRDVKLSCRKVWKVYGANPQAFFDSGTEDPVALATRMRTLPPPAPFSLPTPTTYGPTATPCCASIRLARNRLVNSSQEPSSRACFLPMAPPP